MPFLDQDLSAISLKSMSQEQLSALPAKHQEDKEIRERLKEAVDLDAAVAIAKEIGFDIIKEDFEKISCPKRAKG